MNSFRLTTLAVILMLAAICHGSLSAQDIPLPEHPRPDFMREQWENLNGTWSFAFDSLDQGLDSEWSSGETTFNNQIQVPFPWGSELSGVEDDADIGWYQRSIEVNEEWQGKRVFITIGASDWHTTVWVDGNKLGSHRGGYVPFSFELTNYIRWGEKQDLVIRADDIRRDFTLYGKQGYGNARGIWQTVYMEARGQEYVDALHITPNIDEESIRTEIYLPEPTREELGVRIVINADGREEVVTEATINAGSQKWSGNIAVKDPHLWSLNDPFLYDIEVQLEDDEVKSYFGMRKISVVNLPGTDFPYVALNDQPIYLQMALDQSYHPEGYYTFPSDQFIKEEIERSKSIGLNGIRTHIKVEVPRKLYWADKMGLLVMEDLPNSWGQPDERMKAESEYTLRQMIKRDYNHPSIFSWVVANETWGLITNVEEKGEVKREYTRSTQDWLASMYYLARSLDPTRLVEDNSICCGRGHTETDLNTWHVYLPGWEWDNYLKNLVDQTYPGSSHNFEPGFTQGVQPNFNSECGNVWGYSGSTGDVDWSWDYHRMINSFRKYPKVGGWLYTEHHDVINEWNGYWRFDRTEKETGLGYLMEGMSLNDLHADIYLSTGNEIARSVDAGTELVVPQILSSMTGEDLGEELTIEYDFSFTNMAGEKTDASLDERKIEYRPWIQKDVGGFVFRAPSEPGLGTLKMTTMTSMGEVLHRNFFSVIVRNGSINERTKVLTLPPGGFSDAHWSEKHWEVMEGKKINGSGKGYFEYTFEIPEDLDLGQIHSAYFIVEASAKELFVKDQAEFDQNQDYMRGSRVFPSSNPNSYPMTDETKFPSQIGVFVEGKIIDEFDLPDDPADHRGVLSWYSQLKDRKLREAGSYGYKVKADIPKSTIRKARRDGTLKIRLESKGHGGLAIYGRDFGQYPFDPSIVIVLKE